MDEENVIYKCEKCPREFKRKCDLNRHERIKKPCGKDDKEKYKIEQRTCEKCLKIFCRKDYITEHLEKSCKNLNIRKQKLYPQLLKYGNEDISFITEDNHLYFLGRQNTSIIMYTLFIFKNKDKPFNRTIKITNYQDGVKVYNGKIWNNIDKKDIFKILFERIVEMILELVSKYKDKLRQSIINRFEKLEEEMCDTKLIELYIKKFAKMFYDKSLYDFELLKDKNDIFLNTL